MMVWLIDHPNVEQSLISPRDVDRLVNHDFADYYSTYAASHFAAQVWTNNVWVAALCLALGRSASRSSTCCSRTSRTSRSSARS